VDRPRLRERLLKERTTMDVSTKPSVALRDAAQAAAKDALARAAQNAAKPGKNTTEFWTSILMPAAATGGMVLLKVLGGAAVVSMPWLAIPVAAGAAALAAFGYSASRGNVKSAALDAAQAALKEAAEDVLKTSVPQSP
jgi:hypothetical protein